MTSQYPVLAIVSELKQALKDHRIVILQAPPGAGKSTVLPLQVLEEPWLKNKKMIMLEPRRLAARSVAHRMASMLREEVGERVGFRIRFEHVVGTKTRIEVVTEGILTRMLQSDNTLADTGLVIFDEFHERSLQADLALALTLQVQQILRDDLRVLIMSATLDGQNLSGLLGNVPVISSEGKQYPITIQYHNIDPDAFLPVRVTKMIRKALAEQHGDMLVFLPGVGEIRKTQELLELENTGCMVLPLYGELPFKKQQQAIVPDPAGRRKIVLATSIAETSLTIEGITTVIDSGYARVPRFDLRSGLTRLTTVRVTKDSADQRAGRAGRLGPGVCYRLWNEATQQHLVPQRTPEILEADLSPLLLELAAWGVRDVNELMWITLPPNGAVSQAKDLLQQLEALEDNHITVRGKEMASLPTHPRIAHMLLESSDSKAGDKSVDKRVRQSLAADIAALLEERDPLEKEAGVDLSLRIEALRKWRSGEKTNADHNVLDRIEKLAANWRKILKAQEDNSTISDKEVGILLAAAYPERIAKQTAPHGERYKLANGRLVKLPSHDPLINYFWIAVGHLDAGEGEGKVFLAAPLDEEDLRHLARTQEIVKWDDARGMVVANEEQRIGNLVLASKPLKEVNSKKRVRVLCDVIRDKGLKILGWNDTHTSWQNRVLSLRTWRSTEQWLDVSDEKLLSTMEAWLTPYLTDANKQADLERIDLMGLLTALLPWELQMKMDTLAPLKIKVPSGSMITITYFKDGRPPIMEVRLQEMFGLLETPVVNEGKVKIILHLLSPGFKPVQVTQDLRSFWQNTYHEVRKELRMRYPKHFWPEDPWTAEAVRGVKRKS